MINLENVSLSPELEIFVLDREELNFSFHP